MSHIAEGTDMASPLDELDAAVQQLDGQLSVVVDSAEELPEDCINLHRLRHQVAGSVRAIRAEIDEVRRAARVLAQGKPLAPAFPDGTPAPLLPSPRQVAYLARLAAQSQPGGGGGDALGA